MARQLPRPTNVPTIIQGFACGSNSSIAAVTEYRWTSLHENGHVERLINGFQSHQNAICIERSKVALGHDAFETLLANLDRSTIALELYGNPSEAGFDS